MIAELQLKRWNKTMPPTSQDLRHALQMEGLSVLEWSDAPGTIYPVHTHPFVQVRVMLGGHMRVGLPETGEEFFLSPGDRLDVPAETPHWEEVNGSQAIYLSTTSVAD